MGFQRIERIRGWLREGKTVVLLCFEPEAWKPYCHRFILKAIIENRPFRMKKKKQMRLDCFSGINL